MKNNLKWLLIMLSFGVFVSNVNAEETEYVKIVDNDGYSISVDVTHDGMPSLNMTLNGMEEKENTRYYVKFVNENDEMPALEESKYGCDISQFSSFSGNNWHDVASHNNEIYVENDWYMLSGYNYAYVVRGYEGDAKKEYRYYCEITKEPIKVNRPDLPKLGERYDIFFHNGDYGETKNSMHVSPTFPYRGTTESHMLNVKIGVINDNNVLSKLANNTSDSLTSLMEYAKNNDGKVYQLVDNTYVLENTGLDIIPNAYYYIYTSYENENGLYRDLSDIAVVQANEYGYYLSTDVRWLLPEVSDNWKQLIAKMTSNEKDSLRTLYNLNVEANNNIITVSTQKDDKTYTIDYTYKDGIVSASASSEETYYILGNVSNSYVLNYVSEILHYNTKEFRNWLNTIDDSNLSLQKDGIEYTNKVYKTTEGKDIEYYSDLKINIDNGINAYYTSIQDSEVPKAEITNKEELKQDTTNVETTVENPKTGLYVSLGVLVIAICSGVFYIVYRKKNYFNKI